MPLNTGTAQSEQTAGIRRLKLLVALLLVLCVLLGGFCAYLLRTMDSSYTELIDRSLPVLNELHDLSRQALTTQRGILNVLVRANAPDHDEAIKGIRQSIAADQRLRDKVCLRQILIDRPNHAAIIDQAGDAYDLAAGEVADLLAHGRIQEADIVRHDKARVALNLYLDCINSAAHYVETASLKLSENYSEEIRGRSAIMLGLAGLPVLLFAGILAAVLGVILTMWLVLRRAGFEDGP